MFDSYYNLREHFSIIAQRFKPLRVTVTDRPEEIPSAFFPKHNYDVACLVLPERTIQTIESAHKALVKKSSYFDRSEIYASSCPQGECSISESYARTPTEKGYIDETKALFRAFTNAISSAFSEDFTLEYHEKSPLILHRDNEEYICVFNLSSSKEQIEIPNLYKTNEIPLNSVLFFTNKLWHQSSLKDERRQFLNASLMKFPDNNAAAHQI